MRHLCGILPIGGPVLTLALAIVASSGCTAAEENLKPGDPAPDFELAGEGDAKIKLADYEGKPVVLATMRGSF